jgi:hypothetical protein
VAHTVARRLAVRQARDRILARHPRRDPLLNGSHEEIKRVLASIIHKNIVCLLDKCKKIKIKIIKKSGSMPSYLLICSKCFAGNHHVRAPYCLHCDDKLQTDVFRNFY